MLRVDLQRDLEGLEDVPHRLVLHHDLELLQPNVPGHVRVPDEEEILQSLLHALDLGRVHLMLPDVLSRGVVDLLYNHAGNEVQQGHVRNHDEEDPIDPPERAQLHRGVRDTRPALRSHLLEMREEGRPDAPEEDGIILVVVPDEEAGQEGADVHQRSEKHEDPENGLDAQGEAGLEEIELLANVQEPDNPGEATEPEDP